MASNFNFENFLSSHKQSDGSISLSGDDVTALLAGYREISTQQQGGAATTGDANAVLNAGLSNTSSLYDSSCYNTTTDCAPLPQPTPEQPAQPQADPLRPYEGAGVQTGAERAFNRGDRAFAKEVEKLTNAGENIYKLADESNSPADVRSWKKEILHELRAARRADHAGRVRFHNGAEKLGDEGTSADGGDLDAGRGILRNNADINLAIRAVKHNDFDTALDAISNRIGKVKTGVQTVRDGVNNGFLDTGV